MNIPYIAKVVADLKGIDIKKVERETTMNAKRLFGTKIIFRVIVYMSLLSTEEIMMCFISNIIWPEQKDTFLNEVSEEEGGSV